MDHVFFESVVEERVTRLFQYVVFFSVMYPSAVGMSFVVQQETSGGGQFTGAEYGRARVTLPNGDANAVVRVAARLLGNLANSLLVELVDRGAGNAVSATYVEQVGTSIRVLLRRSSSGSPLATAAEVAGAINDYARYTSVPITAVAGGTGLGVCSAVAPTAMTGGRNFWGHISGRVWSSATTYAEGDDVSYLGVLYRSIQGSNTNHSPPTSSDWWQAFERPDATTFRWKPAATNLGLFHFEQERTLVLQQFEAKFTVPGGTHSVRIERVPLNAAFEPVTADAVPVFVYGSLTTTSTLTSGPDITLADVSIKLPPRWAFRVVTDVAMAGIVRMDVRREQFI